MLVTVCVAGPGGYMPVTVGAVLPDLWRSWSRRCTGPCWRSRADPAAVQGDARAAGTQPRHHQADRGRRPARPRHPDTSAQTPGSGRQPRPPPPHRRRTQRRSRSDPPGRALRQQVEHGAGQPVEPGDFRGVAPRAATAGRDRASAGTPSPARLVDVDVVAVDPGPQQGRFPTLRRRRPRITPRHSNYTELLCAWSHGLGRGADKTAAPARLLR